MSPADPRTTERGGLNAHVGVDRGHFRLDVDLNVASGQVLALLGPNGAGKTTMLRTLAGLIPLTDGEIHLGGTCLDDPVAGTFVATSSRRIGIVFQDYLLFPHLSAIENVAFGPRARGVNRHEARNRAHAWLKEVGLESYLDAKPSALSGGQAQRVALARALVTEPQLLLLDEPLAALDAGTRLEIRSDLRRHLEQFDGVTVLVTHDPLDAMSLADHIMVIENGRTVQHGTPTEVARAPRTDYVARLVGLNLYRGTAHGVDVTLEDGSVIHTNEPAEGDVLVAFRPSAVAMHRQRPEQSSPRNVWSGTVSAVEQHADTVRVQIEAKPPVLVDLTTSAVAELDLVLGTPVWVSLKATETHTYPA